MSYPPALCIVLMTTTCKYILMVGSLVVVFLVVMVAIYMVVPVVA